MGYSVDVELIECLKDVSSKGLVFQRGLIFNLLSVLHSIIEMLFKKKKKRRDFKFFYGKDSHMQI